jgi:hypothetical protein
MSDTLPIKELIEHFADLKALRNNIHFRRLMNRNDAGIVHLQDSLMVAEPTEAVRIASLQAELMHMQKFRDEFRDCEKLLFELEKRNKPAITNDNQSGLVPPE